MLSDAMRRSFARRCFLASCSHVWSLDRGSRSRAGIRAAKRRPLCGAQPDLARDSDAERSALREWRALGACTTRAKTAAPRMLTSTLREAWDTTTGSRQRVAAVVDTGIAYDHPDLAPNIWANPGEVPGDSIDNDGNGKVDDHRGWDFIGNDNDPRDLNAHGTHVAGHHRSEGNNMTVSSASTGTSSSCRSACSAPMAAEPRSRLPMASCTRPRRARRSSTRALASATARA